MKTKTLKSKTPNEEIITFGSNEYAELFMKAVKNTENKTHITNETISRHDNMIKIYETKSIFLIEIGQEYQKLLDENLREATKNNPNY